MKVSCDHCTRTATALRDDLIEAGWSWVTVTEPFQGTFTGCPDHAKNVIRDAVAAIDAEQERTGRRRTLAGCQERPKDERTLGEF